MSDDAPEIQDMFALRDRNPLVVYGAPWKRGPQLMAMWIVLIGLSVAACSGIVWLQNRSDGWFLLTLLLPLAVLPMALQAFMAERREERLEEFRLTLLRREEVVFGSFYWAVITALVLIGIWTVGFTAALARYFAFHLGLAMGSLAALAAAPYFAAFFLIWLTKGIRLYLAVPRHRWTVALTAPLATLVDVAIAFGIAAIVFSVLSPNFNRPNPFALILAIVALLVALFAMVLWNMRVAMQWAVALYYREIEQLGYRQLFLPTAAEREAIARFFGMHRISHSSFEDRDHAPQTFEAR